MDWMKSFTFQRLGDRSRRLPLVTQFDDPSDQAIIRFHICIFQYMALNLMMANKSSCPMHSHLNLFALALSRHQYPVDQVPDDYLPIRCGRSLGTPQVREITGQERIDSCSSDVKFGGWAATKRS